MASELTEESIDEIIKSIPRDKIKTWMKPHTYIINDFIMERLKSLSKGENLLDYLDKLFGSDSTIVVSPEYNKILSALKKEKE